jgi:hypothetical protein
MSSDLELVLYYEKKLQDFMEIKSGPPFSGNVGDLLVSDACSSVYSKKS